MPAPMPLHLRRDPGPERPRAACSRGHIYPGHKTDDINGLRHRTTAQGLRSTYRYIYTDNKTKRSIRHQCMKIECVETSWPSPRLLGRDPCVCHHRSPPLCFQVKSPTDPTKPNPIQRSGTQPNPTQPNPTQPNPTQRNATQTNATQAYPTLPNPTEPDLT